MASIRMAAPCGVASRSGGVAPKGSPAELATHCRTVLAHSSQQGIIVSLCFYAWAGLHYALAAIGMVKHMKERAVAQA